MSFHEDIVFSLNFVVVVSEQKLVHQSAYTVYFVQEASQVQANHPVKHRPPADHHSDHEGKIAFVMPIVNKAYIDIS
jgi:hypothetical protein